MTKMSVIKRPWTSKKEKDTKPDKMNRPALKRSRKGNRKKRNKLTNRKEQKDGAEPSCKRSKIEILIQRGAEPAVRDVR